MPISCGGSFGGLDRPLFEFDFVKELSWLLTEILEC